MGESSFILHISRGDLRLPKKKLKVKKPKEARFSPPLAMRKADIEQAMASYEEEMMKNPQGAKILKEEKEELEQTIKEGNVK